MTTFTKTISPHSYFVKINYFLHGTPVVVREQLIGVSPWAFQVSNAGLQAWQQLSSPLTQQVDHWALTVHFKALVCIDVEGI